LAATAWKKSCTRPPRTPNFRADFNAASISSAVKSTKSRLFARLARISAAICASARFLELPVMVEKTSAKAWERVTPRSRCNRSCMAGVSTAATSAEESQ
jgi:hypothetical protein